MATGASFLTKSLPSFIVVQPFLCQSSASSSNLAFLFHGSHREDWVLTKRQRLGGELVRHPVAFPLQLDTKFVAPDYSIGSRIWWYLAASRTWGPTSKMRHLTGRLFCLFLPKKCPLPRPPRSFCCRWYTSRRRPFAYSSYTCGSMTCSQSINSQSAFTLLCSRPKSMKLVVFRGNKEKQIQESPRLHNQAPQQQQFFRLIRVHAPWCYN